MIRSPTLALAMLPVLAIGALAMEPSASERDHLAAHVRPCWPRGGDAIPAGTRVIMSVVTEKDGTAIDVAAMASSSSILAGEYGPAQRALSAQAKKALLDPRCNPLPVPARLLGHRQMFDLVFGP